MRDEPQEAVDAYLRRRDSEAFSDLPTTTQEPETDERACEGCGEPSDIAEAFVEKTWQQWQCPCCGFWNDREE